jgi:ATP-dependent exoDNAse (exonuclease V) beta subunit
VVDIDSSDDNQVVREVARLLADLTTKDDVVSHTKATIGVLVRKNMDAIRIHRALVGHGIPAALAVKSSVFNSELAPPLHLLLLAILSPESAGIRKAALLARPSLLGMDGDVNATYAAHGEAFGGWLRDLRKTWKDRGIGACWEELATTGPEGLQSVRLSLARSVLPQRYLADFNHLGELLSKLALERHLTMEALVENFAQRIEGANPDNEEDAEDEQVRAETANPQVIVRTIHSAKGLEYEGVVLPLFEKNKEVKKTDGSLLRIPGEPSKVITQSSDDSDLAQLSQQNIDEDARVLYVALTRARRRLVLLWANPKETKDQEKSMSGFSVVLSRAGIGATPTAFVECLDAFAELAPKASDGDLAEAKTRLVTPTPIQKEILQRAPGPGQTFFRRSTSSFTRLTEKANGGGLGGAKGKSQDRPFEAFASGRRAKSAGTYLHRLLELLDFQQAVKDAAYVREIAERELRDSGLFLSDPEAFAAQLELVCNEVPVWLNQETSSGFALKDVSLDDRMAEVRFAMRLRFNEQKAQALRGSIQNEYQNQKAADGTDLSPLSQVRISNDEIEGMLTGSIDLALRAGKAGKIYIVDWKSNQISEEVGGYSGTGLVKAMSHSSYHLQYTLYAAALRMHLRACHKSWDPSAFGGVHYIFLRAFGRKNQGGDFFYRPSDKHLDEVTRVLTED